MSLAKLCFIDIPKFSSEVNTELYTCPYENCDFSNVFKGNVTTHERIEHKIFECHWCRASFSLSHCRERHERIHKEKSYPCREGCDMSFTRSCHRNSHEYIHNGIKPFPCRILDCSKKFAESGGRNRHERTHSSDKLYTCRFLDCGKKFSGSGHRIVHERLHSGDTPFMCRFLDCGKKFSDRSCRRSHENHNHIWPKCVICLVHAVPPNRENQVCGHCARGVTYGSKQHLVFKHLFEHPDERLNELFWSLIDQPMNCGVLKRPDGLIELKTEQGNVKLILETDEFEHKSNTPECEISRLYEIRDRDKDAIYVVRYNTDTEGALDTNSLDELADRLLEIIEFDHIKALQSSNLIHVEYIGYSNPRIELLTQTELKMQTNALAAYTE